MTLDGSVPISSAFFWPLGDSGSLIPSAPLWPHLQILKVVFNPIAPDGTWYITGAPSSPRQDNDAEDSNVFSSADDSGISSVGNAPVNVPPRENDRTGNNRCDMYRIMPASDAVNPLYVAAARAAMYMPRLQEMRLHCSAIFEACWLVKYIYLSYLAPGSEDDGDLHQEDAQRTRLYFETGDWRAGSEVIRLWEMVARERGDLKNLLVRYGVRDVTSEDESYSSSGDVSDDLSHY